jgi:hypothetical protein
MHIIENCAIIMGESYPSRRCRSPLRYASGVLREAKPLDRSTVAVAMNEQKEMRNAYNPKF